MQTQTKRVQKKNTYKVVTETQFVSDVFTDRMSNIFQVIIPVYTKKKTHEFRKPNRARMDNLKYVDIFSLIRSIMEKYLLSVFFFLLSHGVIVFGTFGSRDFSILHITRTACTLTSFSVIVAPFMPKCSHAKNEQAHAFTVSIEMWFSLLPEPSGSQLEKSYWIFARFSVLCQRLRFAAITVHHFWTDVVEFLMVHL